MKNASFRYLHISKIFCTFAADFEIVIGNLDITRPPTRPIRGNYGAITHPTTPYIYYVYIP